MKICDSRRLDLRVFGVWRGWVFGNAQGVLVKPESKIRVNGANRQIWAGDYLGARTIKNQKKK